MLPGAATRSSPRKVQERDNERARRCGHKAAIPSPQVDNTTQSTVNEQSSIDKVSGITARCTGKQRPGRGHRCSIPAVKKSRPSVEEDEGSEFEEKPKGRCASTSKKPPSSRKAIPGSIRSGGSSRLMTPIHEHDSWE